jgi:hypothetical protein
MEERLKKVRVDVTLGEAPVVGLNAGLAGWTADHHLRVFEVIRIVRSILRESEHTRNRGSSAAGSAGALLIVLPERRNGTKTDCC